MPYSVWSPLKSKMVDRLTEEDFDEIKNTFLQLDMNSDGTITRAELASSLCKQFKDCTKEDVETYMRVLDVDRDGKINFIEFVTMTALFKYDKGTRLEEEAKEMFKVLKKDSRGYVSIDEMKRVWKMFLHPKGDASNVEVNAAVQQLDSNKDGRIDQKEFINHFTSP